MGFGTPVVVSYHPPLIDFLLSSSRITSPCPSCSLSTGIHALHLGGTPLPSLRIVRNLFHSSYPILPFFLVRVAPLTKVQRSITVINNAPMEYLGDLNRGLAYIRRFRTAILIAVSNAIAFPGAPPFLGHPGGWTLIFLKGS